LRVKDSVDELRGIEPEKVVTPANQKWLWSKKKPVIWIYRL
jgi:hypothetical protein